MHLKMQPRDVSLSIIQKKKKRLSEFHRMDLYLKQKHW